MPGSYSVLSVKMIFSFLFLIVLLSSTHLSFAKKMAPNANPKKKPTIQPEDILPAEPLGQKPSSIDSNNPPT